MARFQVPDHYDDRYCRQIVYAQDPANASVYDLSRALTGVKIIS